MFLIINRYLNKSLGFVTIDLRDFKEQTEKFFLTHKGMPVKVIEEYQSVGNKIGRAHV